MRNLSHDCQKLSSANNHMSLEDKPGIEKEMLPSWHPSTAYVNSSCANRTLAVMVWTWAHMVNGWFPTDGVILGDAGNLRWGLPGRKGVMGDAILKSISGPYLLLCFPSAMKSTASSTCSPPPQLWCTQNQWGQGLWADISGAVSKISHSSAELFLSGISGTAIQD